MDAKYHFYIYEIKTIRFDFIFIDFDFIDFYFPNETKILSLLCKTFGDKISFQLVFFWLEFLKLVYVSKKFNTY